MPRFKVWGKVQSLITYEVEAPTLLEAAQRADAAYDMACSEDLVEELKRSVELISIEKDLEVVEDAPISCTDQSH